MDNTAFAEFLRNQIAQAKTTLERKTELLDARTAALIMAKAEVEDAMQACETLRGQITAAQSALDTLEGRKA